MDDLWQYLKRSGAPVVLYGTGNGADKIIAELERCGIGVNAVFASDGFVRERTFHGMRVRTFDECLRCFPDMKVLMCFGSSRPEVLENVHRIASQCEFFAPDVPVYGENIFNADFYEHHKAELEAVRNSLCDEKSVKCFDCHVKFKLTGDIRYLEECETDRRDIESEFFGGDVFIDLGAYNGDTVRRFAELEPIYKRIIAVEPDARNFRKLKENTAFLPGIVYVNAAVADKDGEVMFARSKGRGSAVADKGEKLPCRSVDLLVRQFVYETDNMFIKMDVEGSELDAINGAQLTLRKYKPSMCIAGYHRSEDLFAPVLRVLKLVPDYKVFMRHSPQIPAWDTEFYFTK